MIRLSLFITMVSSTFLSFTGSYIQASKKTFSKVRGGGTREAGALSFERHDPAPNKEAYKNWAKSVIENPVLVENKVRF